MDDSSDLNSTMNSSFTGTNMDDISNPGDIGGSGQDMSGPNSPPSGLSKLKTKLKNAFAPDQQAAAGQSKAPTAPASTPSIYSGIQSTMNGGK